jgi:chromate transporter
MPTENDGRLVTSRTSLRDLARVFLALGTISFGGPAAHIAMMEDEVVRRRRWLTREEFLDYVGATNLIPGPNSTELAIHVGHARAGWPGLLVAGASFILPAAIIVGCLAWGYVRYGALPSVVHAFAGVKPVVIAIVAQALWRLARTAVRSLELFLIGIVAVVATALGVNELIVLAGGASAAALLSTARSKTTPGEGVWSALAGAMIPKFTQPIGVVAAGGAVGGAVSVALWPLFGVFLKTGAVLFGSGYVLLAFLRADLVDRLHWITQQQLLDAVAVGQITPGPVFTTATFVGYLVAGGRGAAVATLGIFLPAFFFVAVSGPLVPRIRKSRIAGATLDGVNVASLALMAVVTWTLARSAIVDAVTLGLAVVSAVLLVRYRVNSAWLVAGGGLVGIGLASLR